MQLTGIIPINKPVGTRSTSCVEVVRRTLGRKNKLGHGGTLDSTASGLLILLSGKATRLSNLIMDMPKTYVVTIQFGVATSTEDATGDIVHEADFGHITDDLIDSTIPSFLGWRMQVPPVISAVHVNGRRAHELSRNGERVVLKGKPVFFRKIDRTSHITETGSVSFRIECRRGTYIRSFARDLGVKLGTVAHVTALCRTAIGCFSLEDAFEYSGEKAPVADELINSIVSPSDMACRMNSYAVTKKDEVNIINGIAVKPKGMKRFNYADFTTGINHFILFSDNVFSVSKLLKRNDGYVLKAQVNLLKEQ